MELVHFIILKNMINEYKSNIKQWKICDRSLFIIRLKKELVFTENRSLEDIYKIKTYIWYSIKPT